MDVDPDQLAGMLDLVLTERGSLDGFDVAVSIPPGGDPAPYAARGATWILTGVQPHDSVKDVQTWVEAGPEK